MGSRRVLVVDDEPEMLKLLRRILPASGYTPLCFASAEDALAELAATTPSIAIVDVKLLGGMDGVRFAETLRSMPSTSSLPIILYTSMPLVDGIRELIEAELDVVIKQKSGPPSELLPAIERALQPRIGTTPFQSGPFRVDPIRRRIWINGHELKCLSPIRYLLLSTLIHEKRPLSSRELLTRLSAATDSPGAIKVSMCRLRRALAAIPGAALTHSAEGYRLEVL